MLWLRRKALRRSWRLLSTVGKAAPGESTTRLCEAALTLYRCRADVVPALVEKALGATRAGTKKKGGELCAMFVEVENGGEGVMVSHPPRRRLK